jgi:hypothetical protein
MALVWLDSFDTCTSGHFQDRYDSWHGPDVSRFTPLAGRTGNACRFDTAGGEWPYLVKILPVSATYTVGLALRPLGALSGLGTLFLQYWRSGDGLMSVDLDTNGRVRVGTAGGTIYGRGGTICPSTGFTHVEVRITNHATTGSWELRVNGAVEASGAGVATTGNGWTAYDRITVGAATNTVAIDDLYVTTASGSSSTGFLGMLRVAALFPQSDGAQSQWTSSDSGTHALDLDETNTDNETTYVYTAASGAVDLYQYGALAPGVPSGSTWAVTGVLVGMTARRDDVVARSVAPVARIGGVVYPGPAQDLTQEYVFTHAIWERSPATSAAWTTGAINAAQFGLKLVT